MKKKYVVILFLLCFFVLSACGQEPRRGKEITNFTFTNQDGQSFGTEDLLGKVWIADFIFTECKTVCPPMTSEMAKLQKKFKEDSIEVEFVSFTVDPKIDTPDVLKKYIQHFTDDQANWNLLTGVTQEEIEVFAREQFQTIVQKPKTSDQVIHGTNFYLIDPQGFMVNEFNFVEPTYVDDMIKTIKKIQN